MVNWSNNKKVKIPAIEKMPRGGLLPSEPCTERGRRRAAKRAAAAQSAVV